MVLIQGKEYITVAERINILHGKSENVDILTEILSSDDKVVLVKATIKIDDRIYTGQNPNSTTELAEAILNYLKK